MPLRQARERPDEIGGQAADQTRAHEHRVDVPVSVVIGEDGAVSFGAQIAIGAPSRHFLEQLQAPETGSSSVPRSYVPLPRLY